MILLKGDAVARHIKGHVKADIEALVQAGGEPPHVVEVLVGEDEVAHLYLDSVERAFSQVGIDSRRINLSAKTTTEELVDCLQKLAHDCKTNGILLPTPLPKHISLMAAQDALPPDKDIEGISSVNVGRLALGKPKSIPATPLGGIEILKHYGIPIDGKRAVVLGRSAVVGWPMATLLTQAGATVTVCHTHTVAVAELTREADVLVSAAGRPGLVTADMVKPGATIIDFGISMTDHGLAGDVDFEAVSALASAMTPVPGGTGPVTAAVLVRNVVEVTRRQLGR